MRVDIVQTKGNKTLRRIAHDGEVYVMAPKKGSYKLRVYNHTNRRRMAVVTVDGVNVISGEDGDFDGSGYVLGPRETVEIPGWRRDDGTVAAFLFRPEKQSYANQTGRGTKNVGVVGVATFDEKEKPASLICRCGCGGDVHHHHYNWPYVWRGPYWSNTTAGDPYLREYSCSTTTPETNSSTDTLSLDAVNSPRPRSRKKGVTRGITTCDTLDVGTGYGHEVKFQTTTTTFERATTEPAEVTVLRYATRERLESWGVPLDGPSPKEPPQAFPKSQGPSVPPPPGWRG